MLIIVRLGGTVLKKANKTLGLYLADIAIANFSVFLALIVRLADDKIAFSAMFTKYIYGYLIGAVILSVVMAIACRVFEIYKIMWKYARVFDAFKLIAATFISFFIYMGTHVAIMAIIGNKPNLQRLPLVVYLFGGVLALVLILSVRLFIRTMHRRNDGSEFVDTRIMLIGGGRAGNILLHDLQENKAFASSRVVCIIDDKASKLGMDIYGVRVVGTRDDIIEKAKEYEVDQIVFAIPNSSREERAEILNICSRTGCEVRTVPSLDQMMNQKLSMASVRKVNVEDLLGREPIRVDMESIAEYIEGRTVMVTGGGGSIGSELCRQLAKRAPKRLIIFDIYENNAYNIQNELRSEYPGLAVETLIGSVRDKVRLDEVFSTYRPDIVYHAAAHKHVPLMEDSPKEAIKNNVFGTLNVVNAADKYGVKRFVMISTDKAVNPTNIMGASKRICEMIVQTRNRHSSTEFVAVRFGNVLGSNGSVIPLFEKQIAEGGPVTVTDKRIVRYFMTIPEAVSLVLQAGAFCRGGEIFVLDMGKPMKIVELAENLIRLSGYEPYRDIDIKFIGLRPGEKLYEELLMKEEGLKQTANKLIYIGKPIDIDEDVLDAGLKLLADTIEKDGDIRAAVKSVVDTYKPAEQ